MHPEMSVNQLSANKEVQQDTRYKCKAYEEERDVFHTCHNILVLYPVDPQ